MAIYKSRPRPTGQTTPHPDPWFGIRYNINIYRGCEHQCIYCDSRSECYQIENFADVLVKVNAIERLEDELPASARKGSSAPAR
jgi:DNA repair photolyase